MEDPTTEITVKPATKQTVEIIVNEVHKSYILFIIKTATTSLKLPNQFYLLACLLAEVYHCVGAKGSRVGSELQCGVRP